MKAMLLDNYKHLSMVDMPRPEVGPRDLLVAVKACGICGSDIHGYDGSSGRRIPPLVMGHEAAGVIVEVGEEVERFGEGDRVAMDSTVSCGHCEYCRGGHINLCKNRQVLGVSCNEFRRHGAFAEYVVIPENIAYKLPDAVGFVDAAMIEAVSIAVHAANRTPKKLGGSAVVVGSGMIGLLCIQAIKLAGFTQVFAVDLDDDRLALAKELGATHTLNAAAGDLPATIAKLNGGEGCDVALEVVGATAPIKTAIESTRRGGAITLVGNISPLVEMPLQSIVTRELTIAGSCASNGEIPECIRLLESGAINVRPLITATADLEEGPQWFERLYGGERGAMKVILTPSS